MAELAAEREQREVERLADVAARAERQAAAERRHVAAVAKAAAPPPREEPKMRRPQIMQRTVPLNQGHLDPYAARRVRDVLTSALGVNVDVGELDGAEQSELRELVDRSQEGVEPGGVRDLAALPASDRTRVEKLVEKALDDRGLFDRRRVEAEHAREVAALAARANRPKPVTSALSGDVLEQLAGGFLDLDHLTMLALVSVVLDAAEIPRAWQGGMRFEAGKLVLEYVSIDLGEISNMGQSLFHLQANGWLTVEGSNQRAPWTIKPGPRLQRARRQA